MKTAFRKTLFVTAAVFFIAGLAVTRSNRFSQPGGGCLSVLCRAALAAETVKPAATNAPAKAKLPRLVDLGADKCIPCKLMAPVLKELTKEYEGRMEVEFLDVWKYPDAGKAYKVKLIPTQLFFDAGGQELFRHEGFYSKKDILAKWKELGVNLKSESRDSKADSGKEGRK